MMNDSLQGRMSPHEALLVKEHTPEILQRHGLPDLPMLYTQNHLRLAVKPKSKETPRNQHGLTKEILARIPEALETPAVIMRSASKEGRIVGLKDKLCVWGVSPMRCCRGWCGGVRSR